MEIKRRKDKVKYLKVRPKAFARNSTRTFAQLKGIPPSLIFLSIVMTFFTSPRRRPLAENFDNFTVHFFHLFPCLYSLLFGLRF